MSDRNRWGEGPEAINEIKQNQARCWVRTNSLELAEMKTASDFSPGTSPGQTPWDDIVRFGERVPLVGAQVKGRHRGLPWQSPPPSGGTCGSEKGCWLEHGTPHPPPLPGVGDLGLKKSTGQQAVGQLDVSQLHDLCIAQRKIPFLIPNGDSGRPFPTFFNSHVSYIPFRR